MSIASGVLTSRTEIQRCVNFEAKTWGILQRNPVPGDPLSYIYKNYVDDFVVCWISDKELLVLICEEARIY